MLALTSPVKPSGGVNYDHWTYLRVSRLYLKDSIALLRISPVKALRGGLRGWLKYSWSSTDYGGLLAANVRALRPVWWNNLLSIDVPLSVVGFTTVPLFFLLGLLGTLAAAALLVVRAPVWAALSRNQRLIVLFLCVTAVGFAVVACCFETGENNRMRAEVDPVHVVLLGVVLDRIRRRVLQSGWPRSRLPRPGVAA